MRVAGDEISWSLLHNAHEKDAECQAKLRAGPKLSKTILHPGNCKQSVSVALTIFDPSTRAAILKYFPQVQDSLHFINFFIHGGWCPTQINSLEMAIDSEMLQLNTTVSQNFFERLLHGCWNGKMRSFLTVIHTLGSDKFCFNSNH